MKNLLIQTKEILESHQKTLNDIIWFGSSNGVELIGDLEKALNFNYDSGFGSQEVYKDLILVGIDFWLERHEYDGSEWWEYKTLPKRPKVKAELGLADLKVSGRADSIYDDEDSRYSLVNIKNEELVK